MLNCEVDGSSLLGVMLALLACADLNDTVTSVPGTV